MTEEIFVTVLGLALVFFGAAFVAVLLGVRARWLHVIVLFVVGLALLLGVALREIAGGT